MKILLFVVCIFLMGCSTASIRGVYNETGDLIGAEAEGKQESSVEQTNADGSSKKFAMNNKSEPLINLEMSAAKL